jgi:hypothetical protein
MTGPASARRYCPPESLAYAASAWKYQSGAPLVFDDTYRAAHLPLVAPEHPAVLPSLSPLDYESGRYRRARYSLILPIESAALGDSPAFRELSRDLLCRTFAQKVAWELIERRATKLHVTLAAGLEEPELERVAATVATVLRAHGPLNYRLAGPFVGSKNYGRIYFPAYPELGAHGNVFSLLQSSLGRPETRLYLLGYYNLLDELTPFEAAELNDVLTRWSDVTIAELTASSLVILGTHDDLALDSEVVARISEAGTVTR